MTANNLILIAVDVLAIAILSLAIYFPRHKRRDLVVAFFGANIGVLAIAVVLGQTEVALGLGLGLFGVLSIIRLRSSEISQRDVAYYFSALAIGLICGLQHSDLSVPLVLVALILGAITLSDSKLLFSKAEHQTVRLDKAIALESELFVTLEEKLNAKILGATVLHIDFVNDTTDVDVRFSKKPELLQTENYSSIEELVNRG